jgi:hypothetical protein
MRYHLRTLLILAGVVPAILYVFYLFIRLGVEIGRVVEPLPRHY